MKTTKLLLLILAMLIPMMASADPVEIDGIYYNLIPKATQAEVTKGEKRYSGAVRIPETINVDGTIYTVALIAGDAFSYNSNVTDIWIPRTITGIASGAFMRAEGLQNVYISDLEAWLKISFGSSPLGYAQHLFLNDEEVVNVNIPQSITTIRSSAFSNLVNLRNVIFHNNVEKIETSSFAGCINLNLIQFPESLKEIGDHAFSGCSNLSFPELPRKIEKIDFCAFQGCKSLTSLNIPANLTDINYAAFIDCGNLSTISVDNENPVYDSRNNCNAIIYTKSNTIYRGCVSTIIPDDVEILGQYAFSGCSNLIDVIIPNSVKLICAKAFDGCENLKSITIGKGVTDIEDWAFSNCSNLVDFFSYTKEIPKTGSNDIFENSYIQYATLHISVGCVDDYKAVEPWKNFKEIVEMNDDPVAEYTDEQGVKYSLNDDENTYSVSGHTDACTGEVTIPSSLKGCSVTSIGNGAFQNCYNLTSVNIPNSVTSIGTMAFQKCTGLTSVTIPNSVTSIGSVAFSSCSALTSVNIPNSVTEIGLGAFDGCGNLTSITIPNSLTSINEYVFASCGLTSVTIPNSVTSIGDGAFSSCKMTSITIGSGVTSINHSFTGCQNLTDVYCLAENVPQTSPDTYDWTYIGQSTLHVPEQSIEAYKAVEPWKNFKNIVEITGKLINVETAGTLATKISNDDKFSITELTITGQLNGTDLRLLREMAGNNYKGQPTEGKLQKLDLSDATIVVGGDTYLDLDDYYINIGNNKQLFCFDGKQQTTEANTFGKYLFAGCQQLKMVKTPTSLIMIYNQVFAESGLTNIELNNGLTTLDRYALWQSKLSSIMIPKTVIHIGDLDWVDNPFAYNDNLTSITLEAGNSRYSMSAGGKLLIDNTNHAVVCALGNETIPDGITAIGSHAFCNRPELVNYIIPEGVTSLTDPSWSTSGCYTFNYCVNLESIVIPEGIKVIPLGAFMDCPKLNSVTIPSSVENIQFEAFDNTGLTEITIPANVTSIGGKAFAHNQNLKTVISNITNPFDIDDNVFAISETTYPQTLKVPYGTKALYEAKTGWNKFANIVEMAQPSVITVTAKSYSRAYGETNPTFEFDVTGGTVTGTPEITCAATATSGVGTYDIVITAGTITDPNVQYVNGTLTVTKAPLKITAKSYTKKQGEENPEFGVTYEGFKNSETDAVLTTKPTVTCTATKDSPVGTYDITVSGAVAANYEISYVAGKLTIEAAPAPEPTPEPTPMPEPKGTTFDLDTDDSSTTEVKISFVVKESDSAGTPTVAISDDKDASGSVSIPESVMHNGVEYKVTEISEGAFQNNTSLTEVKIPASITSIGPNAFAGCKNLQAITINIIVPINIAVISARGLTRTESSNPVFEGVDMDKCILYVPEGSVDAYKAAPGWKDFKNILVIGSATGIKGIEMAEGETFDVFNLYGLKVKSQATSLDGLPKGIYVVKGKKVMK